MEIKLNRTVEYQMKSHAEQIYPNEACGFFLGKDSLQNREVSKLLIIENSKKGNQRNRFEISPYNYLLAEQYALSNNLDLLGIYHSHPDHPAVPSTYDLEKALPYFSYIIISVYAGESKDIRSWILNKDQHFIEENLFINN